MQCLFCFEQVFYVVIVLPMLNKYLWNPLTEELKGYLVISDPNEKNQKTQKPWTLKTLNLNHRAPLPRDNEANTMQKTD